MLFGNCNENLGDYCKKWEKYCVNMEHCKCDKDNKCSFCKINCQQDFDRCKECSLGKHKRGE